MPGGWSPTAPWNENAPTVWPLCLVWLLWGLGWLWDPDSPPSLSAGTDSVRLVVSAFETVDNTLPRRPLAPSLLPPSPSPSNGLRDDEPTLSSWWWMEFMVLHRSLLPSGPLGWLPRRARSCSWSGPIVRSDTPMRLGMDRRDGAREPWSVMLAACRLDCSCRWRSSS